MKHEKILNYLELNVSTASQPSLSGRTDVGLYKIKVDARIPLNNLSGNICDFNLKVEQWSSTIGDMCSFRLIEYQTHFCVLDHLRWFARLGNQFRGTPPSS